MNKEQDFKPLVTAGTVLGLGMGGFFDGIVFHQILQIHNMVSNRYLPDTLANAEINMFWDGLFHAFTWIMTLIGLSLLWKATGRADMPRSSKALMGSMIFGWGLFNFVEGIIDHMVLQVHHVVQRADPSTQLFWDIAFLGSGVVLILAGRTMIKQGRLDVSTS